MGARRFICMGFGALALAVSVTAQAQISTDPNDGGGTETFAGIAQADAAVLSMPADLANWSTVAGTALPAGQGAIYDTTAGGGTLDSAAFTAGGSIPPETTSDLILHKSASASGSEFGIKSPTIGDVDLNDLVTWTFYFAQVGSDPWGTAGQVGRYMAVGVVFPEASNPLHQVGFAFVPSGSTSAGSVGGGDIQVHYGNLGAEGGGSAYQISSTTAGVVLLNNVGASQNDNNDYDYAEWNRVDIEVTLTAAGAGTADVKYNGATIQSVALSDAGNLRKMQFLAGFGPFVQGETATRRLFIDDVSVSFSPPPPPPNAVEDWMRFFR